MLYQKGIAEYVNVAKKIRAHYPNTEFRLLGFIDTKNPSAIPAYVIEQWHREGAINYLGISDKVEHEIAEADCIVLPSYYREGVPRSLLEGAAMGKPLITTDNIGCRETVDDGINGFLCKPRNEADLYEKVEQLLFMSATQRREMGAKSREKIEREFDEKTVISFYIKLVRI